MKNRSKLVIALVLLVVCVFNGILYSNLRECMYTNDFKINRLSTKISDFYFNMLTLEEKKIYTAIATSVKELAPVADVIVDKDLSDIRKSTTNALEAFFNDHPEVFYLNRQVSIINYVEGNKLKVRINLNYKVDSKEELEERINFIEEDISSFLSSIEADNSMNLLLKIYNKFIEEVEYDYSNPYDSTTIYHDAEAFFTERKAVCDGMSKALQLILNRVSIDTILVVGNNTNGAHAWLAFNKVNVNVWRYLDITADATFSEGVVSHYFFDLTFEEMSAMGRNVNSNFSKNFENLE